MESGNQSVPPPRLVHTQRSAQHASNKVFLNVMLSYPLSGSILNILVRNMIKRLPISLRTSNLTTQAHIFMYTYMCVGRDIYLCIYAYTLSDCPQKFILLPMAWQSIPSCSGVACIFAVAKVSRYQDRFRCLLPTNHSQLTATAT